MYFESINLGKIKYNVAEAEPVLRDSDIVSFNINSVKAGELNNAHQYPNGLSSYELCSLSRFSGLSSRVNIVSYFEILVIFLLKVLKFHFLRQLFD